MNQSDWGALWRELSLRTRPAATTGVNDGNRGTDPDVTAARFDAGVKRKTRERPDTLLDFVLGKLRPQNTVLDIGAGTGRFAIPFARVARSVTAVEPSPGMTALLRDNAAAAGLSNIHLLDTRWEDAQVAPHHIAFCSHAMYSCPELVEFVRKMERHATDACYLAVRMPSHDGVMQELSQRIHGQPHDSPNFWVAYQLLYQMGIYADVVMEPLVRCWTDASLEDALLRARRHLYLPEDTVWNEPIRDLLTRRLDHRDGRYYWPDGMRSALIWWKPSPAARRAFAP